MNHCTEPDCRCPVEDVEGNRRWIGGRRVCLVCFDMFVAIYSRRWFINAQKEWMREMAKRRGLMPGAEYLE